MDSTTAFAMGFSAVLVLGILAVFLPTIIIAYFVYRYVMTGRKLTVENRAKATFAEATITGITQGGGTMKANRRRYTLVTLQLTIHDRFEGDRQAFAEWWVDNIYIPQIQPGTRVNVKIGAGEDKTVYPEVEWAGAGVQDIFRPR